MLIKTIFRFYSYPCQYISQTLIVFQSQGQNKFLILSLNSMHFFSLWWGSSVGICERPQKPSITVKAGRVIEAFFFSKIGNSFNNFQNCCYRNLWLNFTEVNKHIDSILTGKTFAKLAWLLCGHYLLHLPEVLGYISISFFKHLLLCKIMLVVFACH